MFLICVCVCLATHFRHKQQRSHSSMVTSNNQRVRHPNQQQPVRKPTGNVYIPSLYNISPASLITSIYEASPPSYGIASAELPSKYESTVPPSYEASTVNLPPLYTLTTQPPVIAMVEQTNSPV
ncbi:hypothetical protein I4U23_011288 [Adineta vaga]|nr:hypothetical protein I4U23_011288 [Adineta vaga]